MASPAGRGALNPEKHLFEKIYFVVEGRGSTEVWLEGDSKRHTFEWQQGSLFSIPLNAYHRIVSELRDRNLTIVDEELQADQSVKIRVRNF